MNETKIPLSQRHLLRALPNAVVLCLATVFAPPAEAADKENKTTAPSPVSWAGFYLGVNAGAGIPLHTNERLQAGSGFTTSAFDLYPLGRERSGAVVGAQLGYNWQIGPWVYGLETDFGLLDGRGGPNGTFAVPAPYAPLGVYSYTLSNGMSAKYSASIRGRLGFALDRTLYYVTGGVAAGGARGDAALAFNGGGPGNLFTANPSQSSRMKYLIGAGAEYALDQNWSARLEYLFLSQSLNTQVFDNGAGFQYVSRTRNENHLLRAGLNYRFNDAKPEGGDDKSKEEKSKEERVSVHGQLTSVAQGYPKFPALYSGPNSFTPKGQARVGMTANLFAGARLWDGGAVYLNPEVDEGYGLSNSVGAAAYVNGAVAKVGRAAPYMRFQRYFFRQIIGLGNGGKQEHDPDEGSYNEVLESTQNQLSGKVDRDRLILTVGKFAVPDIFDDNVYAHDPTTGFMNFAVNTLGAFDYAADAWGYTYGAALEWKQNWWTVRGGFFQLSDTPNSLAIEPVLGRQFMGVAELEGRYELFGQPGAIKFLAFGDNGYLSKMDEIVNLAYATGNFPPQVDTLRKRRLKTGEGVNIKQQVVPGLGVFLRASINDGRYETVDYTDIDRSLSMGVVASGELWGRAKDEIGGAVAFNGLSGSRVRYFAAGGTSVYIGDGALSYGGEHVLETYYKYSLRDGVNVTFDYQFLHNPAYNLDRGPVSVFGVRLHAEF